MNEDTTTNRGQLLSGRKAERLGPAHFAGIAFQLEVPVALGSAKHEALRQNRRHKRRLAELKSAPVKKICRDLDVGQTLQSLRTNCTPGPG